MKQKTLNKIFIYGFLFLYLLVALISFCHAVEFFSIGNATWMSIVLAFAFELGLAISLMAILLSDKNKKNTMPWVLMSILVIVQVVGNLYATYKHIALSTEPYYQYLSKPLLFFLEDVSEESVQIIVSWIMGAILPIVALFMTDMVASNIKNVNSEDETDNLVETKTEQVPAVTSKPTQIQSTLDALNEQRKKEDEMKKDASVEMSPVIETPVKIEEPVVEETKPEVKKKFLTKLKSLLEA